MSEIKILLLSGGGGSEHDISLVSANYLEDQLKKIPRTHIFAFTLDKDFNLSNKQGDSAEWKKQSTISINGKNQKIDYVIPCIHGHPGETGELQGLLDLFGFSYLGNGLEASNLCFNKVSTKLWLEALHIPNTPFLFFNAQTLDREKVFSFFDRCPKGVFIKAASQGSSVGCYPVTEKKDIEEKINEALKLSEFVLIEEKLKVRELEVSTFEYQGKLMTSFPSELVTEDFYSFEEKYGKDSKAKVNLKANISQDLGNQIQHYAKMAFTGLKLKDLARIDFFLTDDERLFLNEINTFPGMTPISMFPKMLETCGLSFQDFLENRIQSRS